MTVQPHNPDDVYRRAAADQFQAVIDRDLNEHIAALHRDLGRGVDRSDALVATVTAVRQNSSLDAASMLLAAALMRLTKVADDVPAFEQAVKPVADWDAKPPKITCPMQLLAFAAVFTLGIALGWLL